MMYSGDEYYSDDVTSPLERPAMQRMTTTPRRIQVRKVKRAMAKSRNVYEEFADLYDEAAYQSEARHYRM